MSFFLRQAPKASPNVAERCLKHSGLPREIATQCEPALPTLAISLDDPLATLGVDWIYQQKSETGTS